MPRAWCVVDAAKEAAAGGETPATDPLAPPSTSVAAGGAKGTPGAGRDASPRVEVGTSKKTDTQRKTRATRGRN